MVYKTIPKTVIERVPLYINYLKNIDCNKVKTISATIISQELGLGEVLVRKDLNMIAGIGKPKIGYYVSDLREKLRSLISTEKKKTVIIVGIGKIGEALARYKGFGLNGFDIIQLFDSDVGKIGRVINQQKVNDISNLESYCQNHQVDMAVLSVDSEHAQDVCNRLSNCGIKGILNFTNVLLITPNQIIVRNVDIVSQLMILALEINNNK